MTTLYCETCRQDAEHRILDPLVDEGAQTCSRCEAAISDDETQAGGAASCNWCGTLRHAWECIQMDCAWCNQVTGHRLYSAEELASALALQPESAVCALCTARLTVGDESLWTCITCQGVRHGRCEFQSVDLGETVPDADPAPGYGDDEGYDSLSVSDTDDGDTTAPGADPAPGYGTPSSSCGNRHNWVELRRTPGTPALCCSLCTVDLWRPPAAGATGGTPEVLRCLECGIAVHGAHVPGAPGSSTDAHGTVVTVRHVDDEDGGQDAESFSSFSDSADDDEDSVDSDSDSDDDTTTYICTGCLERYALRGDKPAWRCTDMACVKALYCPDCITDYTERLDDGSHVCGSCKVALVTQVSNRRQRTERIERPFGTKLTNSSWQPGHRVPQGRTMLCYAAAVATACRCAGYPATLLECMHAFLMSEKVEQSVGVLAYRRDFEAARRAAPDKPPADVLNDMEGLFAGTMKTAVSIGGVPVFPDGFTGDPLFQQNMTPAQVVAALDQGMVVMAGDKSHWVVIIGYRSDNGVVSYFEYFDPAGVGAVVLDRWDTQWVDFYCVRA